MDRDVGGEGLRGFWDAWHGRGGEVVRKDFGG